MSSFIFFQISLVKMKDFYKSCVIWINVFLLVHIKNHWTLLVFDLHNFRMQLLDSQGGRKKTQMIEVYQNLVWNDTYKHLEIYTYCYIMFL